MARISSSDQNQSGKPQPEESTPKVGGPGLDPRTDPKIVVKAVNPPVTPDQVVGIAEMPAAATLDLPKLQNIKISPVKNKTIQGHLRAIEAKMTATEKLMKDIIKLQKVQIITEKEVFERKRELYQNTFEEYLLDKTVDFGDPDAQGGANSIKKGPGGGFPFPFGGRRRRPNNPGGPGAPSTTVPPKIKEEEKEEEEEKIKTGSSGLANLGVDYKQQEQEAIKKAEEFRRQQEQKTGVAAPGKKSPQEQEQEQEVEVEPATPVAPQPTKVPRPLFDPKLTPPFIIPDVISMQGVPATPPMVTIPNYDMRVKTQQQELAGAIEEYIENNPGSEFDIKLGRGAYVDTGHLIKKKDGKVYIHEPLTQEQLVLIGGLNWSNLSGWMPIVPIRGGRRTTTVPSTSFPRVTPKVTQPSVSSPPTNTIKTGPKVTPVQPTVPAQPVSSSQSRFSFTPQTSVSSTAEQMKSTRQRALRGRSRNASEGRTRLSRTSSQRDRVTRELRRRTDTQADNQALQAELSGRSTPQGNAAQRQAESDMILERFLTPQRIGEVMPGSKVTQEKPGVFDVTNAPKASGGIGDLNLYSSEAMNYFRGMSSKIVPMADGGLVGWWNKGRNMRVPSESTASWKDLMADDAKQLTRTNKAFKSGATGIKGWNPIKAFTPDMVRTGPTPAVRQAFERPARTVTHPLMMALEFIINDLLINPRSTAVYDQVTGPNAYYNAPGYKGPMPSQNLENAQSSMMSGNNDQQPQVVPLPPDYIKIPGKKKAPDFVGDNSPDIVMRTSIFTRNQTDLD